MKTSLLPSLNLGEVINVNHVNENRCGRKIGVRLDAKMQVLVHVLVFLSIHHAPIFLPHLSGLH